MVLTNLRKSRVLYPGLFIAALLLSGAGWDLSAQNTRKSLHERYFINNPLLEDLLFSALERNPQLRSLEARYRAALQKIPQVRSLPDPVLSFTQYLRSPETRVGPQSNITAVSQRFPWFGKLDLKGRIAASEADALYQEYLARERFIAARVKEAFYDLACIDRLLDILEEERLLLDHFERLAEGRYTQGEGHQHSVIRLQAEITRLDDREKSLAQQRKALVSRINMLADRDPDMPVAPLPFMEIPEVDLNQEALLAVAGNNRRELRASLDRIEKSEQAIALARKSYWPDFTIGAGMANIEGREDPAGIKAPPPDNGKNAFSLSFGINIPLWRDKYRAEVIEAAEMKIAERQNYASLMNEIEYSVSELVSRLRILKEQVDLYDRALIIQAREALNSAEAAYEVGQGGVLDLLDSERFLLNTRLVAERYRADYLKALALLEEAVGNRFPDVKYGFIDSRERQ